MARAQGHQRIDSLIHKGWQHPLAGTLGKPAQHPQRASVIAGRWVGTQLQQLPHAAGVVLAAAGRAGAATVSRVSQRPLLGAHCSSAPRLATHLTASARAVPSASVW